MTSSKDIQHPARPLGQHRLSMSSALGSSLPARSSHPRHHSHSISVGSLIPTHRVTRRKSGSANAAAVAAAVREMGEATLSAPMPTASSRRHTTSRTGGSKFAGLATPPSSLPGHRLSLMAGRKAERDESAIDDEHNDEMDDEGDSFNKARMRRASEGQSSVKSDGKKNDLRCDKCGKGYKHSSCLTKHLWEHTPEWSYTSKLLISKHQQVQLLEAASVLVAMNQDGPTPPPSAKDFNSDHDSASPAASGSSDPRDGLSSTDTTPPPQTETPYGQSYTGSSFAGHTKRYSSGNNFSRSYQSAPSNGLHAGSISNGSAFGSFGQQSHNGRPLSSGISAGGLEDEAGLAAAVELLSCSFGTPRTGPVTLPPDVPPVPPLPARYLAQGFSGTTLTPNHQGSAPTSYIRGSEQHDGDVKMEESEESVADDDDYDLRSRGRSDEDDDGVFGRMEE
ncbi:hypothetical protein V502_10375 [Pseudogymnoascus sp. VKM F-4520 (FW-2644)]|nr:hypothetical protein V502_10375 [Pseudogymnoascus sp. VKM F-4520 (FW-2644)]